MAKKKILIAFLLVFFVTGVAAANNYEPVFKDSQEDQDPSIDPTWTAHGSNGISYTTTSKDGDYGTSVDGDYCNTCAGITTPLINSDKIEDGDKFTTWVRTSYPSTTGMGYTLKTTETSGYYDANDKMGMWNDGSGFVYSTEEYLVNSITDTQPSSDTWYFYEIVAYPSSSEANFRVLDSDKNLVGESGRVSVSNFNLNYVDIHADSSSAVYDEITYGLGAPPEFNYTSSAKGHPFVGEAISYDISANDPTGEVSEIKIEVFNESGDNVATKTRSYSSKTVSDTFSDVYIPQSEQNYTTQFTVTNNDSIQAEETIERKALEGFTVSEGETTTLCGDITDGSGNQYNNILIAGTVNVCDYDGSTGGKLNITASEGVYVTGTINGTGAGYSGGSSVSISRSGYSSNHNQKYGNDGAGSGSGSGGGPTYDPSAYTTDGIQSGGGAGFGASGMDSQPVGANQESASGGLSYGTQKLDTLYMGSGGGSGGVWLEPGSYDGTLTSGSGGDGGGLIYLNGKKVDVAGDVITNGEAGENGTIDSQTYAHAAGGGGGSGGGIKVSGDTVVTSGVFKAIGGDPGNSTDGDGYQGGPGAGGRISIRYRENYENNSATFSAIGGSFETDLTSVDKTQADSGTIYEKIKNLIPSSVIDSFNYVKGAFKSVINIDDNGESDIASTSLASSSFDTFTNSTLTANDNFFTRTEGYDLPYGFSNSISVTDSNSQTATTNNIEYDVVNETNGYINYDRLENNKTSQYIFNGLSIRGKNNITSKISLSDPTGSYKNLVLNETGEYRLIHRNGLESFEDGTGEFDSNTNVVTSESYKGDQSAAVNDNSIERIMWRDNVDYSDQSSDRSFHVSTMIKPMTDSSDANRFHIRLLDNSSGTIERPVYFQIHDDKAVVWDNANFRDVCTGCINPGEWHKMEITSYESGGEPSIRFDFYNSKKEHLGSISKNYDGLSFDWVGVDFEDSGTGDVYIDQVDSKRYDIYDYKKVYEIDSVSTSLYSTEQNLNKQSTLEKQYFKRNKEIDNSRDLKINNFSSESISDSNIVGECQNCEEKNFALEGNTKRNVTYKSQANRIEKNLSSNFTVKDGFTVQPNKTIKKEFEWINVTNNGTQDLKNVKVEKISSPENYTCSYGNGIDSQGRINISAGESKNISEGVTCESDGLGYHLKNFSVRDSGSIGVGNYHNFTYTASINNTLAEQFEDVKVNVTDNLFSNNPKPTEQDSLIFNKNISDHGVYSYNRSFKDKPVERYEPSTCPDGWLKERDYCHLKVDDGNTTNHKYRFHVNVKTDTVKERPIVGNINLDHLAAYDRKKNTTWDVNGTKENVQYYKPGGEWTVETDFGNSSLHKGNWYFQVEYGVEDDTGGVAIGGGSSGGGGGQVVPDETQNETTIEDILGNKTLIETERDTIRAPFTAGFDKYGNLDIINDYSSAINVTLKRRGGEACKNVDFVNAQDDSQFQVMVEEPGTVKKYTSIEYKISQPEKEGQTECSYDILISGEQLDSFKFVIDNNPSFVSEISKLPSDVKALLDESLSSVILDSSEICVDVEAAKKGESCDKKMDVSGLKVYHLSIPFGIALVYVILRIIGVSAGSVVHGLKKPEYGGW